MTFFLWLQVKHFAFERVLHVISIEFFFSFSCLFFCGLSFRTSLFGNLKANVHNLNNSSRLDLYNLWELYICFYQGWGAGKFLIGSGSGSWLFFQVAPAPAPDFFPKRLRLRLLVFFQAAPAPAPRSQKHPAPTGSGPWLLVKFAKIFFSSQTSKVKRQKNIKQVK